MKLIFRIILVSFFTTIIFSENLDNNIDDNKRKAKF